MPRNPLPPAKQPLALTQDEQADMDWAKRMAKQFSKGTVKASQTGATERAVRNVNKKMLTKATEGGY